MNYERNEIVDVLDVRSDERIVVIGHAGRLYPGHWEFSLSVEDARIGADCVVVVDQVDLTRKMLQSITKRAPRLIAFVVETVDSEKQFRRTLKVLHPWAEVWDGAGNGIWTNLGKVVITAASGKPYNRDDVPDMRLA